MCVKVIAMPGSNVWFAPLNTTAYNSQCVFRGNVPICCKFNHLHTVILVVKSIDLKTCKIKELIFLIFFRFLFLYLLLFISACPHLTLWLCVWNDPETTSPFRDIHYKTSECCHGI